MRVFVSYAREDRATVQVLVADLESLHHDVWYDSEIVGGHDWWSTIIEQIAACDLFVPAVSSGWLASDPCKTELDYSAACNRPVLPVAIEPGIAAALPAALARRQVVDCSSRSADTSLALVRALADTPPAPPLPNPPPPPPPAPVAPLAALGASLDADEPLTADAQRVIARRLSQLVHTDDAIAARALARRMLQRSELLGELTGPLEALTTPPRPAPALPAPSPTGRTKHWVLVAAVAVLVTAATIAIVATRGGNDTAGSTTVPTLSSSPSIAPDGTADAATTPVASGSPTAATASARLASVPTVRILQSTRFTDDPRIEATVDYIQLDGLDNSPLEGALNDRFASDARDAITSFASQAGSIEPAALASGSSTLTRRISSQFATGRVLSFRLDESTYFSGSAHPNASFETVTIDLTTGRRLTLADLFRPAVDYMTPLVAEVSRQLVADYPDADASIIRQGLGADNSSALRNWVIEREGIRFAFGQCDVLPCALGTPEVLVDYPVLRTLLEPAGVLSELLT